MTAERSTRRPVQSTPAAAHGAPGARSNAPGKLADALRRSPRAAVQRAASARIQGSPYMVAQRKRLGVVQARDPGTFTLDKDALLTHGSAANVFDIDRKPAKGFSQTTDTDKPGGPAWMAQDNEKFSVHATLVTQGYKKLGEDATRSLTVHTYTTGAIDLHRWGEWRQVPEYLYRNLEAPKDYAPSEDLNLEDREVYAYTYAKEKNNRFKLNSVEAAHAIKSIAGGDGYHLDKDLVLGQPEEILFEGGLAKLKKAEKREFEVSWIQSPKKQMMVMPKGNVGGTYYWDPNVKKVLSTSAIS